MAEGCRGYDIEEWRDCEAFRDNPYDGGHYRDDFRDWYADEGCRQRYRSNPISITP